MCIFNVRDIYVDTYVAYVTRMSDVYGSEVICIAYVIQEKIP